MLGFDVGDSESGAFWTAFLRSLKARGLAGVQLVISDAHTGLKAAIGSILLGASWQRCRIHFGRTLLAVVPAGHADMVAAAVRTIFAQPDAVSVRRQLGVIASMLGRPFPKVETLLRDAACDITPLAAQHGSLKWTLDSRGRIKIESKDDMRKRGMPSPDRADTVAQAFSRRGAAGSIDVESHKGESITGDLIEKTW